VGGSPGANGSEGQQGNDGLAGNPDVAGTPTGNIAGTATHLVISPMPPIVTTALPFQYPVYVLAEDDSGYVDPTFDLDSILLTASPNDQALQGTLLVDTLFGVAEFTNLEMEQGGTGDTLEAFDLTLTTTPSPPTNPFDVNGYSPAQLRTAYGISNLSLDGSGQTIAIIDAYGDPNIYGDLDAFDKQFGITTTGPSLYSQYGPDSSFLTVVNQLGQTTNLPGTNSSGRNFLGTWESEEAMDVEWAHAIAPGAKIVLVEANNQDPANLYTAAETAASLPGVSVVSMSFGYPETSAETTSDSAFSTPIGHEGVTFLAASGDDGAPGIYPADSPNVVAVGGTNLSINSDNSYASETGWTEGGGGVSQYETEPSYQEGVQNTGYRTIPDVAFDADPATGPVIYNSFGTFFGLFGGSWSVSGGTSFATPCWAGLIALVNEGRVAAGGSTLDSSTPDQTLTALYSLPNSDFNKNISGNNGTTTAGLLNPAVYNEVTGLGSPVANDLVPDLVSYGLPGPEVLTVSPTSGPVAGGTTVTITGANLADATAVDFGTTSVTHFISDSASQIVLVSPAGTGTVNVSVVTANGTSLLSDVDLFTFGTAPGVTGLSQTAGPVTGGTSVAITGVNLARATSVEFGSTPATIISDSANEIVVTSPSGSAGTVNVTVTTTGGTASSPFTYVAVPIVTGVSPTTGPSSGGTSVTITGSNLANAIAVDFGSTPVTIVDDSATQIVVTSPAVGGSGAVGVTVITAGGTTGGQFTYFPVPEIAGVSPAMGPTAGGTEVTITGINLAGATAVDFGSTAATIVSDSPDQLVVTSPAGGAGVVDVTVTSAEGTSAVVTADQFTYIAAPAVTGVSPSSGLISGGTTVTITGTNLGTAANASVEFGTTAGIIINDTGSQIVVTSPAESVGMVNVTVTTAGGTSSITSSDQFTFTPPPTIIVTTTSDAVTHTGTSLRDAVALANESTAAGYSETIVFDPSLNGDTISLTQGLLELTAGSGTVTINGDSQITVSGGGASQVFQVDSGAQDYMTGLTIQQGNGEFGGAIFNAGTLTFTNCTLSDNTASVSGGVVYDSYSTLAIINSTFSTNTADYGGSIFNDHSTLTITNSMFSGDIVTVSGGVIDDSFGSVTLIHSTLSANSATYGGAIYTDSGTLTLTNSTLSSNTATYGGAIYSYEGTLILTQCNLSADTVTGSSSQGGGIYNSTGATLTVVYSTLSGNSSIYQGGAIFNQGTVTVSASTLSGNSSNAGGGIENGDGASATLTVTNSTLTGNTANFGGGIDNYGGTLWLSNSTIFANTSGSAGGIDTLIGTLQYMVNTIVAGNSSSSGPDIYGPVIAGNNNIIGNNTDMTGLTNGLNGNQVGTSANPINPLLDSLASNGGPTQTLALQSGSPALAEGSSVTTLSIAIADTTTTTITVADAAIIASSQGDYVLLIDSEEMLVTAVDLATNTLTVQRGYNGTSPATHQVNAPVFLATDQRDFATSGTTPDIGAYQSSDQAPLLTSQVAALPQYSPGTFIVNWSGTESSDGPGIASYTIDVSINGGPFTPWLTATTATSVTFTGLNANTYSFYSVATDLFGNVQPTPSAAQAATKVDTIPPTSSVSALPPYINQTSFTVSWSGSDNNGGSGLASYTIYVSDDGGTYTPLLTGTTLTSTTFTGQNGHTYGFYSVATDNVGNVQPTPTQAQATTLVDTTPPTSTVAALPKYTNTAAFAITWSGSDGTNGSGVSSYTIYVSDDGGTYTPLLTGTTLTSTTFTGQNGHTYAFYSVATDNAGNVHPTPTQAQATTLVDTTPPTSTVAVLPKYTNTAAFAITWSGSDGTNGSGVASYTIYVSDDGGTYTPLLTGTTLTSTTFTGQTGHTYAFYSIATDNAGNVQPTPTQAQATTLVDTTPPTSTVAALPKYTTTAAFTITWSGSDGTNGSGVASYTIYVSDDAGTYTPLLTGTTLTSTTFACQTGNTYAFYSVATDNAGNVQPTPTQAQATTLVDTTAPTSTVATLPKYTTTDAFSISWSGSDGTNGSGIASYTIYVSDDGGTYTPLLTGTTLTSTSFTGQTGHTYAFNSVATDNAGNIQPTPTQAQATTLVDTTPPTSTVAALPTSTTMAAFLVSWSGSDSAGSGIASYTIYASVDGGAFAPWLTATTLTSATYPGTVGQTYGFYSIATNNAGLVQSTPTAAQAATTVVALTVPPSPPVSPPPISPPPASPPPASPPPASPPLASQPILIGGNPNGAVQVYTESGGTYALQETLTPFGNIPTDVRTAVGDVNGDGIPDYIFATGPGTPFEVTVLSGASGNPVLVAPFDPFLPAPPLAQSDVFTAGGFVSAGDFMDNARDQIVVSPDQSGGPRVAIYDMNGAAAAEPQPYTAIGVNTAEVNPGSGLTRINNFLSVNSDFRGGARTAVGDLNGDGVPDLAIAAGFGGGPAVLVINGTKVLTTNGFTPSDDLIGDFFAFNSTLRDGAYLAIGDVLGNGQKDLILGPGAGGPAEVEILSGEQIVNDGAVSAIANPVALFTPTGLGPDGSGMRVAVAPTGIGDQVNVVVGAGRNMPGVAKVYPGSGFTSGSTTEPTGGQLIIPFGGDPLTDGIFVG
jgi:hypothetical protein